MKRTIIAYSVSAAILAISTPVLAISSSEVSVPNYSSQEAFNSHIQGQVNDQKKFQEHLQRSDTNHNAWTQRQENRLNGHDKQITELYQQVGANQDHLGRIEGVLGAHDNAIGANTYMDKIRAKEQAERDDGQDKVIASNQKAVGELQQGQETISSAISETNKQQTADREASVQRDNVLDGKIANNSGHIETLKERADVADSERSDLYSKVSTVDANSRDRDNQLNDRVTEVDTNSRDRDAQIVQQVRDIDQWNIEQFNRHASAINDVQGQVDQVRQDLASEREARKQQGKEANAGIASATAMGMHHFDTNYQGLQLSVSSAGYRGEHAQSLSAGGAINESVFGSVAVSRDSRGNQAWGVQSTFKF